MERKSNLIPRRLRLTDKHPTAIKIQKLFDLADDLGITIYFSNCGTYISDRDRDQKLPDISIYDIEPDHYVNQFPPSTEFQMVYDNPEYLKQCKIENEEDNARRAEEERIKKEKELAKKAAEEAMLAAANEARERKMLADLKEKYKD
ncbi:hypothetical protein UFOVP1290_251 [uncultured Caudovirales phage]|uniref:Uncharacterized protein n=1 Tax=uncultured Caudovirales phage TaxID=2100421 RepID=A0A6J5RT14_9CAUD|nr:hypothetical protein UFOVP1290_251 [uncultured Caudovirales phage]